jgi:uncharacterized protein YcfJ
MIKHTIIASILMTGTAFAETVNARIQDHYRNVIETVDQTSTECQTVQVPIYGNRQSNFDTGGAIVGGLVGGILGNQVGGGSGREAATGVGAIAGAIIGGGGGRNERVITGYRDERQCSEVVTPVTRERRVYSHSTITFVDGGQTVTLNYQR